MIPVSIKSDKLVLVGDPSQVSVKFMIISVCLVHLTVWK